MDKACVDLVLKQPILGNSMLAANARGSVPKDYFGCIHPITNYISTFEHAEKLGFGNIQYELITVR